MNARMPGLGRALRGTVLFALLGLLAGCPGNSGLNTTASDTSAPTAAAPAPMGLSGSVHGGRQPISGAAVVAYEVNPAPGSAPSEIASTTTDANGNFSFPSFSPSAGDLVYLEAFGGDAGAGVVNSAIDLMTVAGICASGANCGAAFPASVNIDELTTVAGTAALQSYLHIVACSTITGNTQTGGNCAAIGGAPDLGNMANTVGNFVDVTSGQASSFLTGFARNATTLDKLDTLANVLADCVNSSGPTSSQCTDLLNLVGDHWGDTLSAALQIAAMPMVAAKGAAIYNLMSSPLVYTPVLTSTPPLVSAGYWTLDGRNAYVSHSLGKLITEYRLGGGGLVPNGTVPTSAFATTVAVDPSGQYAYAADGSDLQAYSIGSDGTLSPIGSAIAVASNLRSLAVDPSGRYVYLLSTTSVVYEYSIGSDGTLSAIGTIAAGSSPYSLAVDPQGPYVYVTNNGNTVSEYSIGSDGTLSAIGTVAVVNGAYQLAVDPQGLYVYVANNGSTVSEYSIGSNGVLSLIGTVAVVNIADQLAVDPNGSYVYVAATDQDIISEYAIGSGGALTPIGSITLSDPAGYGVGITSLAVDPSGSLVYATSNVDNDTGVYQCTIASDGSLTQAVAAVPDANQSLPNAIAVGP